MGGGARAGDWSDARMPVRIGSPQPCACAALFPPNEWRQLSWPPSAYPQFESGAISLGASLRLAGAMQTAEGHAELHALFQQLDKDTNGSVSSKEWGGAVFQNKELLAKYFGGASLPEIGKAFARLDTDGSKDLTWEEFEAGAKALKVKTFTPATVTVHAAVIS